MLPDSRECLRISEAAARVGASSKTLKRWVEQGARLKNGSRLKLRAERLPSGWRFTEAWLTEFVEALTKDRNGHAARAANEESARRAAAMLEAVGW